MRYQNFGSSSRHDQFVGFYMENGLNNLLYVQETHIENQARTANAPLIPRLSRHQVVSEVEVVVYHEEICSSQTCHRVWNQPNGEIRFHALETPLYPCNSFLSR